MRLSIQIVAFLTAAAFFASETLGQQEAAVEDMSSVEGRVVESSSKKPIQGLEILDCGSRMVLAVTSSDGRYAIPKLSPGDLTICTAVGTGYLDARKKCLVAPGETASVDFELAPEAVFSGRVVDEHGGPLAGIRVNLLLVGEVDGRNSRVATFAGKTDVAGKFRVSGMGPGSYRVLLDPKKITFADSTPTQSKAETVEARKTLVPTYYGGSTDPATATPLRFATGAKIEGQELVVREEKTVCVDSALSLSTSERPATERFFLQLTETASGTGTVLAMGVTTPGKPFKICGAAPGSYFLWTFGNNSRGKPFFGGQIFEVGDRTFDLPPINVAELGEQSGWFQLEGDGATMPTNLTVSVSPVGRMGFRGEANVAHADKDGKFTLTAIGNQPYWVSVGGLRGSLYVKQATLMQRDAWMQALVPGAGPLKILISADGAIFGGSVVDKRGNPVPDADVVLVRDSRQGPATRPGSRIVRTNDEGEFLFESVVPGPYVVAAFPDLPVGIRYDSGFLDWVSRHGKRQELPERAVRSARLVIEDVP